MKAFKQLGELFGHLLIKADHLLLKIRCLLFPTIVNDHLEVDFFLLLFLNPPKDNALAQVTLARRVLINPLHHFVEQFYNPDLEKVVNIQVCSHLTIFEVLNGVVDLNEHFLDLSEGFVRDLSESRLALNYMKVGIEAVILFLMPVQIFVYQIDLIID